MIAVGIILGVFVYLICCIGYYKLSTEVYKSADIVIPPWLEKFLTLFWPVLTLIGLFVEGLKK